MDLFIRTSRTIVSPLPVLDSLTASLAIFLLISLSAAAADTQSDYNRSVAHEGLTRTELFARASLCLSVSLSVCLSVPLPARQMIDTELMDIFCSRISLTLLSRDCECVVCACE